MKQNYKMLAIIYLAAIAAPINFYKVPPVMADLIEKLGLSVALSGWLMTVFAIVGLVFALPAGQLVHKLGLKRSISISLIALVAGSTIGYFSTNLSIMLASRAIEGIGLCLLSIAGSTAILAWFPSKGRGLAMGVWATWVPFGTFLIYMVPLSAWQQMWIVGIAYTAIILVAFQLIFKLPDDYSTSQESKKDNKAAYNNSAIWLLAGLFMLFNIMSISVKSYLPLYLLNVHEMQQGAIMTNIIMFASLFGGPLAGLVLTRINAFKILIVGSIVYAGFLSVLFNVDVAMIAILLVFIGILLGVIPAATFYSVPRVMKDESLTSIGMSIVSLGQNTGMVLGPILFSNIIDNFGWSAGGYSVAMCMLLAGAIAVILLSKK